MAGVNSSYPLVEALFRRSRLSRLWFITIIFTVLLLFLILTAILDDSTTHLSKWSFWRVNVDEIILITYILLIYPFMMQLRERAVRAFTPLLSMDEESINRLAADITKPNRRGEWAAVFCGIAIN